MPQFMVLLHGTDHLYARAGAEEIERVTAKYLAWRKAPFTVDGKRLATDPGKILRGSNGSHKSIAATDGPYSETKELLGGYYTIEAANYDDAVKISLSNPHLEQGGTIELRQVFGS